MQETNAAIASKQLAIVNTSEDMEKAKQQLITTEETRPMLLHNVLLYGTY